MLEYLILNEESLPFEKKEQAKILFPDFISILEDAFKNHFKAIRISEALDGGWFRVLLAPSFYIKDWLEGEEKDYVRKVKSIISKTDVPQIPKSDEALSEKFALSDFYLFENRAVSTPSLGAAFLLEKLALSCSSNAHWCPNQIKLWHNELRQEGEVEQMVEAENCSNWEAWEEFKKVIDKQRAISLRKSKELWNERENQFPNLTFVGKSEIQLKNLSVSEQVYQQFWDCLTKLNHYCEGGFDFSLSSIVENTGLKITDESQSVKQNPRLRKLREFKVGGEKVFFGYHVKNFSGALRLHFFPKKETGKIYIGYFGKHLPTTKNRN